jgi:hypothetical protein
MSTSTFKLLLVLIAVGFAIALTAIAGPALLASRDLVGAFAAGFVNPFASAYALDAILCWLVLAVWVAYEASTLGVRHGWVALVLGVAPGVCTAFAAYLLLRMRQVQTTRR